MPLRLANPAAMKAPASAGAFVYPAVGRRPLFEGAATPERRRGVPSDARPSVHNCDLEAGSGRFGPACTHPARPGVHRGSDRSQPRSCARPSVHGMAPGASGSCDPVRGDASRGALTSGFRAFWPSAMGATTMDVAVVAMDGPLSRACACSSVDRASASGAEGRRFESCRARHCNLFGWASANPWASCAAASDDRSGMLARWRESALATTGARRDQGSDTAALGSQGPGDPETSHRRC